MKCLSKIFLAIAAALLIGQQSATALNNGLNIATAGTASQSTTRAAGGAASRAIDGNTNGIFTNNSVTHTNNELSPSWMVELTDTSFIENIIINERTDACCNQRLNNFNVSVLDDSMDVVFSTTVAGNVPTSSLYIPDFGTAGKFVKIQMNNNGGARTLELAEVQVLGGPLANIARNPNAVATQSSLSAGGVPTRAIDGNSNGVFSGGSVTHTAGETEPFWNLDFGGVFKIDELVLFNRTDVCCSDRLNNAEIRLFYGTDEVFSDSLGSTSGLARFSIDAGNVDATSLRISLPGNGRVLSLAEVQVFGVAVPEPTSLVLLGAAGLFATVRRRRHA